MELNISGYAVLIDDEDWEKVKQFKWTLDKQYKRENLCYVTTSPYIKGKKETIKMHRVIMGCTKGDGLIVDHINHNTLDNRKENLRVCKTGQNNMNQRVAKNSTTGYKGVWYRQDTNMYRAMVRTQGTRYNCGQYSTPEEAAQAYDKMAIYLFKEFAHLNFPDKSYTTDEITSMCIYVEKQRKGIPTSKYRGVILHETGKWLSSITYNKVFNYLGLFTTEEEAAKAYDKKAIELKGSLAKTNFPKENYIKECNNEQETAE